MTGPLLAGVEFRMHHARTRAHALNLTGPDHTAAAAGILVLQRAFQDVSDDLHVAMGVGWKASARCDPIFIDHAQRAEAFESRIAKVRERKSMFGVQPADLGCPAFG